MKLQLGAFDAVEINGIKFCGSFFISLCKDLEKGDLFRFVNRQDGYVCIEQVDASDQARKRISEEQEWRNNYFRELGRFCHGFNIDRYDDLCPVKEDSEVFGHWQEGWEDAENTREFEEKCEKDD